MENLVLEVPDQRRFLDIAFEVNLDDFVKAQDEIYWKVFNQVKVAFLFLDDIS